MKSSDYKSLPELFFKIAAENSNAVAAYYKETESRKEKAPFLPVTWNEFSQEVSSLAAGLLIMGLKQGQKVGILANTRFEWTASDIAIMSAGAITVSLYHTCTAEELLYLLNDSEQHFIFVEDKKQLEKISKIYKETKLQGIIIFEEKSENTYNIDIPIHSLKELSEIGRKKLEEDADFVKEIYESIEGKSVATIVYTSGTSGDSKGVILSHFNMLSQLEAIEYAVPINEHKKNSLLAFLTSAHIFQRIAGEWYFISQACPIYYCSRIERVGQYLKECPATVILSVPLILEKIRTKVTAQIDLMEPNLKAIVKGALSAAITLKKTELSARSETLRTIAKFAHKAIQKGVLKNIKDQISPTLRAVISGGAPISQDTIEFYHAIGIHLIEGYGLTETTGILCCNPVKKIQVGSVGRAFRGVELKIDSDGEILAKGDIIFQGYLNKPEATSECLTEDNWFKTGDIGRIDEEGNLFITGRKKDLIVTAGGKKISPALLEEKIKTSSLIDQIAVFGDKQKWLVALITLQKEAVIQAVKGQAVQLSDDEWQALSQSAEVNELTEKELTIKCDGLAEYEKIRRFKILPDAFSHSKDEITHTMKVKRRVIEKNYASVIEQLYQ